MPNGGETLLGEADCLVLTRKQTNKKIDFAAKPWQYMVGTHVRYEANTRWILPITEDAGSIVMVPRDPLKDSHVNSTSETLELVICNDQTMKDKRMNKQTIKWRSHREFISTAIQWQNSQDKSPLQGICTACQVWEIQELLDLMGGRSLRMAINTKYHI